VLVFLSIVFVYCRFPFKLSVRSYSFVIGSSRSALVLLVVLFIFASEMSLVFQGHLVL